MFLKETSYELKQSAGGLHLGLRSSNWFSDLEGSEEGQGRSKEPSEHANLKAP